MHIAPHPYPKPPLKSQTFEQFYKHATTPQRNETAEEIVERIESKYRR